MKTWSAHFIELIIVILGVSIAFWLNQIAEERKEKMDKLSYLEEIRVDLNTDLKRLESNIKFNEEKIKKTYAAAQFFRNADDHKEEILEQALNIGNYDFFEPTDYTYRSMIASGDFKLITNPDLKRSLVLLHSKYDAIDVLQVNYIQALDEGYFPYIIQNFDYTTFQPVNPEMHKSLTLRNFFMYTINDISAHVNYYKSAQKTAMKVDSLLAVSLND